MKKNHQKVWENLYGHLEMPIKSNIKIGDYVTISRQKKNFQKGRVRRWQEEWFRVRGILFSDPVVYELEDLKGEELKGKFYASELSVIDQSFVEKHVIP